MKSLFRCFLLVVILSGCQSSDIKEVINENGTIINLNNLNEFVININKGIESKINYVIIGAGEGDRDVWELSYRDDSIKVQLRVDGKFKKEFICMGIEISSEEANDKYILKECNGDVAVNYELLVSNDAD